MSDPVDGPWDGATEHDDSLAHDPSADGDDPAARASVADRVRARSAARASAPAVRPSGTPLPPTVPSRTPGAPDASSPPAATRGAVAASPPGSASAPPHAATASGDVVLLHSRRAEVRHVASSAPARNDTAAGSVAIVATGADAERVRQLCHAAGLLVPVLASIGAVHEASSVIVIGEPSLPVPARVVHVLRPALSDDALALLVRAIASGHAVADPPTVPEGADPRVGELAARIAALTVLAELESACIDAITTLTGADRAQLLVHDPATGALFSERARRAGVADGRAVAGMVGWCAHTGYPLHASPAGDDPRYLTQLDDPDGKPQSRLLVQPVIAGDRRVHALLVAARRWRHSDFSDGEQLSMRALAAQIATAIDLAASGAMSGRPKRGTLPGGSRSSTAAASGAGSASASASASGATSASASGPGSGAASASSSSLRSASSSGSQHRASSEPAADGNLRSSPPGELPPTASGSMRAKRRSSDGSEPLDLAVVATDEMLVGHVKKLARKARVEVSVLSAATEAPPYYRVLTIGEPWTPETDARVVYAARDSITDEQLTELLVGLTADRAPSPLIAEPPQTAAEARRMAVTFTRVRSLSSALGLAELESQAITAVREMLDADHAYCLFYSNTDGALWSEVRRKARGGDDRKAIAGVVGWSARTGLPANVPRSSADPRWLAPLDDPEGDPNGQLITQPIIDASRRVIGVLVAARRPRRAPFLETDAVQLARFAALASPFVSQLRLASATLELLHASPEPGDDELRAARSPVQALASWLRTTPRWPWAVAGAALGAALVKLAGC